MTRAFEGIKVIDITHVLAGPFAAYQLAVQGAEVIKVEHPDDPDQSRGSGSDRQLNDTDMGTGFLTQASNKRAITLDLKTEAGKDILRKLVAGADDVGEAGFRGKVKQVAGHDRRGRELVADSFQIDQLTGDGIEATDNAGVVGRIESAPNKGG